MDREQNELPATIPTIEMGSVINHGGRLFKVNGVGRNGDDHLRFSFELLDSPDTTDEISGSVTVPDIETVRISLSHKVSDLDEQFQASPVSWAVYQTQWLGGQGGPLYQFNFTRIDSDQWARVTGELSEYDEWVEGEDEDKDEWPVILRVNTEPDRVEDGFVSIAYWVMELVEWSKALRNNDKGENNGS